MSPSIPGEIPDVDPEMILPAGVGVIAASVRSGEAAASCENEGAPICRLTSSEAQEKVGPEMGTKPIGKVVLDSANASAAGCDDRDAPDA